MICFSHVEFQCVLYAILFIVCFFVNSVFCRCDIPRTPHRRAPDLPNSGTGSRTAPRSGNNSTHSTSMSTSIVGIGEKDCHIYYLYMGGGYHYQKLCTLQTCLLAEK